MLPHRVPQHQAQSPVQTEMHLHMCSGHVTERPLREYCVEGMATVHECYNTDVKESLDSYKGEIR